MCPKTMIPQIITLFFILLPRVNSVDFNYPAVFNFGDSNSDTGELTAGLGFQLGTPNGQSYFKSPNGRFCNGRLILDFLSKTVFILDSVSFIIFFFFFLSQWVLLNFTVTLVVWKV